MNFVNGQQKENRSVKNEKGFKEYRSSLFSGQY